MRPGHAFGVILAGGLASLSAACNRYDGWDTCPVPTRTDSDYPAAARSLDDASYFPPGFYSTVPSWKPFEKVTPPERRDPNENSRFRAASALQGLGEESLYARRVEPGLHVYRVLTRGGFGGHWILRAEQRGPDAWLERRAVHYCKRRSDDAYGFNLDMSEKELPVATWLAIDSCMAQSFWTVPMEDGKPPTAPKPDANGNLLLTADGPSTCLVEGVRGGEYHAIERVCGDLDGTPSRDSFLACVGMMESAVH